MDDIQSIAEAEMKSSAETQQSQIQEEVLDKPYQIKNFVS